MWARAADGESIDWDTLFDGYRSAVDFPASAFYREISDHYPDAKVILTVRDPDRWFQSFSDTILHPLTEPLPDHLAAWGKMVRKAIVDRIFEGQVEHRAQVIAAYQRHNERVKQTIPAERLLVYEVAEGWKPLCEFLGVVLPDEPFPKANTTDEFRERIATSFKLEGNEPKGN
jgi:hypothetical protein